MVNSFSCISYTLHSLFYYSIYFFFFLLLFILSISSFLFAHPPRRPLVFWMLLVCVFYPFGGCSCPLGRCLEPLLLFFVLQVCTFRWRQPRLLFGTFRRQSRNGVGRGRTVSRLPTSPRLQCRLHPSICTTNDRQLLGKYPQGSRSGVKHPILPRIR